MLLVSDTGSPGVDQLVVTTGLRGLTAMEIKIQGSQTGPSFRCVHGGALLNPLQALVQICSSFITNQVRSL